MSRTDDEIRSDRLGRIIPPTGMVSPDGDDAAAHQRMVDSWNGLFEDREERDATTHG